MIAGLLHLGNDVTDTLCRTGGLVLLGSKSEASGLLEGDTREGVLVLCPGCERQMLVRAALDLITAQGAASAAEFLASLGGGIGVVL
jgi:hypothetical protein